MLSRWPVRRARPTARPARARHAVRHGTALDRHALPARARRHRDDPRRLRHRQDRARAVAREVGARRRDRLRRLRRARQRADRDARRVPAAHRSPHRLVADGAHDPRREHEQHAGRRARGEHLHRDHARRVLPRPGLPRRADGRQHEPLGRGAAGGVEPARGDARRGGLPRLPRRRGSPSSTSAPARSPASAATSARARSRSSAPSRRPAATSPSRSPSTACASPGRSGASTPASRASGTFPSINWNRSYTLYELGAWFDREVAPDWGSQRAWALDLLQRESSLLEIVQLLGTDSLAPAERVVLETRPAAARGLPAAVGLRRGRRLLRARQAARDAARRSRRARGDGGRRRSRRPDRRPRRRRRAARGGPHALLAGGRGDRARRRSDRADPQPNWRSYDDESATSLLTVEHKTVSYVAGPLLFAERARGSATTSSSTWSRRTGRSGAARCSRSKETGSSSRCSPAPPA